MTQTLDQSTPATPVETDLVAAVHAVLQGSPEPMTLSKIRAKLPTQMRQIGLEELAEALRRQVAANVLYQYPKYRSQQDRFWDRPMPIHVAALLEITLQDGALNWSELRRKLPAYAQALAESILQEMLTQGQLYRHPRLNARGGERFGARPADPKEYLRAELVTVFNRLEGLGFNQAQLRESALELLHEEEWASPPATPAAEATASQAAVEQAETHPDAPDAATQA